MKKVVQCLHSFSPAINEWQNKIGKGSINVAKNIIDIQGYFIFGIRPGVAASPLLAVSSDGSWDMVDRVEAKVWAENE